MHMNTQQIMSCRLQVPRLGLCVCVCCCVVVGRNDNMQSMDAVVVAAADLFPTFKYPSLSIAF